MKDLRIVVLLMVVSSCLSGCAGKDTEIRSSRYKGKGLSELSYLSCEDYKQTALCETAAFLFNVGHFSSRYSKSDGQGKITIVSLFGDLTRRVPLRCDIDALLQELVRLDNEKGFFGRFTDSFSLVGQRIIVCDQKNKR